MTNSDDNKFPLNASFNYFLITRVQETINSNNLATVLTQQNT